METKKITLELTRDEYIRIITSLKIEINYNKRINSITKDLDDIINPLENGLTKIENAWYN